MLAFILRHSLLFMCMSAVAGFLLPSASQALFPFLPYVLFSLMLLTLLGMQQSTLIKQLLTWPVIFYALFHAFAMMIVCGVTAWLLGADESLLLAILAIAATSSLFATPAIVRAIGLDAMMAMAMTIATTLLLPVAIIVALQVMGSEALQLDMVAYVLRLSLFIFAPMLLSGLVQQLVAPAILERMLYKVSPYTIFLVFAFPFGLISGFRLLWDQDPSLAYGYFAIAVALCGFFFGAALLCYLRQNASMALMAAITSGNRNVLLTYTIAGTLLGPAFLPLAGAMQLPTYVLPLLTRWLAKKNSAKGL